MTENLQKILLQMRQGGAVNDPKKQATPIESETDSVIFMGRELRGMNGFKIKSRFNKKANIATMFVFSVGVNKEKIFSR